MRVAFRSAQGPLSLSIMKDAAKATVDASRTNDADVYIPI
jgi:hypothetical protein